MEEAGLPLPRAIWTNDGGVKNTNRRKSRKRKSKKRKSKNNKRAYSRRRKGRRHNTKRIYERAGGRITKEPDSVSTSSPEPAPAPTPEPAPEPNYQPGRSRFRDKLDYGVEDPDLPAEAESLGIYSCAIM